MHAQTLTPTMTRIHKTYQTNVSTSAKIITSTQTSYDHDEANSHLLDPNANMDSGDKKRGVGRSDTHHRLG